MQAIILTAGNGKRLGPTAGPLPKGLQQVGPCSLLEHHLIALHEVGVTDICMVVGFEEHLIRAAFAGRVQFVTNEVYAVTNSLYSLWLARDFLKGPFLQINCDVLAEPGVIGRLLKTEGSALAYDVTSGHDDEHMKVHVQDGFVRAIGKDLKAPLICGENVGIIKYTADDARTLFRAAGEIIAAGGERAWAPAAIQRIASSTSIRAVDVSDLSWCEVDFPQDLHAARFDVWPRIQARRAARLGVSVLPGERTVA